MKTLNFLLIKMEIGKITHKEFYFWLEGYLHDKKISSYDDAATFLQIIKEKMKDVKDVDPFFPDPRIVVPPKFEPAPIPIYPPKEDERYKPPFTITCETKQKLND